MLALFLAPLTGCGSDTEEKANRYAARLLGQDTKDMVAAIHELKDPKHIPVLKHLLLHHQKNVRLIAIGCLGETGNEGIAILEPILGDADMPTRMAAAAALAYIDPWHEGAYAAVKAILNDSAMKEDDKEYARRVMWVIEQDRRKKTERR